MSTRAKLSSRFQIVLPKEIRTALGVQGGDNIYFLLEDGKVFVHPAPANLTQFMRGLGKETWKKAGGGEKFLKEERQAWKKRAIL